MEEHLVGALRFTIDLSQPLYEQILDQVRRAAVRGEIALGDKIPSVRELAQELKVNPNTVMRAYQELERDGLTEKRRGQGTFLTTSPASIQAFKSALAEQYLDDFISKMEGIGYTIEDIQTYLKKRKN